MRVKANSKASPARAARWGSAADCARYCSLSVKTIRRLIRAGRLPVERVGRRVLIRYRDLDRLIAGCPAGARGGGPGSASAPPH